MDLTELGERGAIRRLVRHFASERNLVGFDDDAAAVDLGDGTVLVVSVDSLHEATHFPPGTTPEEMGWMAAAASVSDVAAMGAEPVGLLAALGLPAATPTETLDGLAAGLAACATEAGTEVLGGDTKEAPALAVTTTGLGRVPRDELLPRSGAAPGMILALTGTVGGAAAGLAALDAGRDRHLAARLLRPPVRVAEGRALARSGARAAVDLSDSLALALHALADASGVGLAVDADAIPLDPLALEVDAVRAATWGLAGGGDLELLAAVPPDRFDAARAAVEAAGGVLTAIGEVTPDPERVLRTPDGIRDLPRAGWEHFRPAGYPRDRTL